MKRNKSTVVKKLNYVWCNLVSVNDARCEGCFLFHKENSCTEIEKGYCYPEKDGGLMKSWSQWKEIGPK